MRRWKKRGGYKVAMSVIETLANRGLFRERDLEAEGLSHNWLNIAEAGGRLRRQGRGVWSRSNYTPTRYELVQICFPKAVFWGPSALWLHGAEADEPETLWVALGNSSKVPTTLGPTAFVIRTRRLEADVVEVQPKGGSLVLRAYSVERARSDLSRANSQRILERAANRDHFSIPRNGSFLSAQLPQARRHPSWAPPDEWIAK